MRTRGLIKLLVEDGAAVRQPLRASMALALVAGTIVCGAAFWWTLGPRLDLETALTTWRFDFKLVWAATVIVGAVWAVDRLADPQTEAGLSVLATALAVPLAILGLGAGIELASTPIADWSRLAVGQNSRVCITAIPLLALAPMLAMINWLRRGAPRSGVVAGATAGLLAGAVAALFYALQCTDDSPLFLAVWYVLAIGGLALVGAATGRYVLRW